MISEMCLMIRVNTLQIQRTIQGIKEGFNFVILPNSIVQSSEFGEWITDELLEFGNAKHIVNDSEIHSEIEVG